MSIFATTTRSQHFCKAFTTCSMKTLTNQTEHIFSFYRSNQGNRWKTFTCQVSKTASNCGIPITGTPPPNFAVIFWAVLESVRSFCAAKSAYKMRHCHILTIIIHRQDWSIPCGRVARDPTTSRVFINALRGIIVRAELWVGYNEPLETLSKP